MAKVLNPFLDRQDGKKYFPGDEYTGPRLAEHQKAGLVEKSKPGPKANKADKTPKKNK